MVFILNMNTIHIIDRKHQTVARMHKMMKKPRNYHHGDLKAALIEAALKLIREKGPRGFTLNEASRTAGVSVSAPYNHFKDKTALLIEILLTGNQILKNTLQAAAESEGTPRERLLAIYHAYIEFSKRYPEYFVVMFGSGIDKEPYPAVREAARKAFAVLYDLAIEIEKTPKTARELAVAVWTMAHGFAALSAEGALARAATQQAERAADSLARRLLALDSGS
jgi:AcrR family transcriptional regulator